MRIFTRASVLAVMLTVSMMALCGGAANAAVLDLTSATVDAKSVGWGLGPYLAFDDNLTTRSSTNPHVLPPFGSPSSTNEWIWVDLGADVKLNTVEVDWQISAGVDYTIRTLTDAQAAALGLTPDHAAAGAGNWTTIATAVDLSNGLPPGPRGSHPWTPGAGDLWDFSTGWVIIPGGTPPGTATVHQTGPVARYLMIHTTEASDPAWGNASIWEINVTASEPPGDIPEPATMAMLGLAFAGLGGYIRKRRRG